MRKLKQITALALAMSLTLSSASTSASASASALASASARVPSFEKALAGTSKVIRLTEKQFASLELQRKREERTGQRTLKGAARSTTKSTTKSTKTTINKYRQYGYTSYYHNQLSSADKKLFNTMDKICYNFMTEKTNGIVNDVSGQNCVIPIKFTTTASGKKLNEILNIFKVSNPHYYFLSGLLGYYEYENGKKDCYLGVYTSFKKGTTRRACTKKFITVVDSLATGLKKAYGTKSTKAKAMYLHDYILENCEYDYEVADKILAKDMVTENKNQTQSAWAILMRKKGICMSLSAVYQILGIKIGVPVITVISPTHAWNKVKVGKSWRNVDLTYDECCTEGANIFRGYFLKSDAEVEGYDILFGCYGIHQMESFFTKYKVVN